MLRFARLLVLVIALDHRLLDALATQHVLRVVAHRLVQVVDPNMLDGIPVWPSRSSSRVAVDVKGGTVLREFRDFLFRGNIVELAALGRLAR